MEEIEEVVVVAEKRNQVKENRVKEAISSFLQEEGEGGEDDEEEDDDDDEKISSFLQEVRGRTWISNPVDTIMLQWHSNADSTVESAAVEPENGIFWR